MSERCLYNKKIKTFLAEDDNALLGILCDGYHGVSLTTTREAWKGEIAILKQKLVKYAK